MSGGANNGGGFLSSRGGSGPAARVQFDAEIRSRFGDEVADGMQRNRDLFRQPRALTGREQAELDAALRPILRDMRATGAPLPDIVPEARFDRGDEFVCAWIDEGELGGCGITVRVTRSLADQVSGLAEQLVEWANDAQVGRTTPWPSCPDHPGTHPLWPDTDAGEAVWKCEKSGRVASRIGALPGSEPEWEGTT